MDPTVSLLLPDNNTNRLIMSPYQESVWRQNGLVFTAGKPQMCFNKIDSICPLVRDITFKAGHLTRSLHARSHKRARMHRLNMQSP